MDIEELSKKIMDWDLDLEEAQELFLELPQNEKLEVLEHSTNKYLEVMNNEYINASKEEKTRIERNFYEFLKY